MSAESAPTTPDGREVGLYIKVTDEEREFVRESARRFGMTMTAFVLNAVRFLSTAQRVPCARCVAIRRVLETGGDE
jgi:uncharacterized protein (DUF1778 family)